MVLPKSILVLGAGELGAAFLNSLVAHSAYNPASTAMAVFLRPSTLSSPNASQAAFQAHLRSLGVALVAGDVVASTAGKLASTLKNYDCVIGANGMALPAGTQTKILHAVLEAGVKLYLPWQFGVDYDVIGAGSAQDLFSEQLAVRGVLRKQKGTEWVILSTGLFMSFFLGEGFGVLEGISGEVRKEKPVVRALGSWKNRVSATSVEGIAAVVAEILLGRHRDSDGARGVAYAAGDTVSFAQLAEKVEKVLGREVERVLWDVEFLKRDLEKSPDDGMRKYRVVFAEGRGVAWDMERTLNAKWGIEVEDVEAWLRRQLEK